MGFSRRPLYNTAMKSFAEVNAYLNGLMPETRSRRVAYTLDNMQTLMAFLGNPQNSYKTIHVAGTSGKSSTCYYLSALLAGADQKVGLITSPHVDQVNERIQINTRALSEPEFCREFSIFLERIKPSGIKPTYFEILVAFGFWEFACQKVDYAVVEVGLGGLLDGTNVIDNPDKVCVITDIGYDHTATLGKTLPEIAAQKAGIILSHNQVFAHDQSPEIMNVIQQTCQQKNAGLHIVKSQTGPSNLPMFQKRNWSLALQVCNFLFNRDHLPQLTEQQQLSASQTKIPARMEILHQNGKTIILDGAHNPQKLQALITSTLQAFPGQTIAGLLALARSEDAKISDELQILLPKLSHLIITSFHDQAAGRHSENPNHIWQQSKKIVNLQSDLIPDDQQALQALLQRPEKILLITGSFFLIQQLRPIIINNHDQTHSRR